MPLIRMSGQYDGSGVIGNSKSLRPLMILSLMIDTVSIYGDSNYKNSLPIG